MNEKIKKLHVELKGIMARLKVIQDMETNEWTPEIKTEMDEKMIRAEAINAEVALLTRAMKLEQDSKVAVSLTNENAVDGWVIADDAVNEERSRIQITSQPPVFRTFGDQLQAVRMAAGGGNATNEKIVEAREKLTKVEREYRAIVGLNEGVGSEGGFLVQDQFTGTLVEPLFTTGILLPRCKIFEVGAGFNSFSFIGIDEVSRVDGSRWGGVQVFREEEAATKTATKPKFKKVKTDLLKLIGLCPATDELLEDATALESYITQAFNDEFNFVIDDEIINGNGVGMMNGILTSGGTVSVAKEQQQVAKTILYKNVSKMWARMLAQSRANAIWLINQDIEPQLQLMDMPVGTGGMPVYLPPGGASESPYSRIFGRPVIPIEQCATLGTVGDIVLADVSKFYIARKNGLKSAMSIHVYFATDQSLFRFVMRINGQPFRNTAITPYKGTNTLSSFITLATRG